MTYVYFKHRIVNSDENNWILSCSDVNVIVYWGSQTKSNTRYDSISKLKKKMESEITVFRAVNGRDRKWKGEINIIIRDEVLLLFPSYLMTQSKDGAKGRHVSCFALSVSICLKPCPKVLTSLIGKTNTHVLEMGMEFYHIKDQCLYFSGNKHKTYQLQRAKSGIYL